MFCKWFEWLNLLKPTSILPIGTNAFTDVSSLEGYDIGGSGHNSPRVHHQWLPDELRVEEGLSPDTIKILKDMGHNVVRKSSMGAIQSIMVADGMVYGAADPRRSTALAAGM